MNSAYLMNIGKKKKEQDLACREKKRSALV